MAVKHLHGMALMFLMSSSAMVMAANDGQSRVNQLLSSDPVYRETWSDVVKRKSDCLIG